ncbi:Type II secretory pathway, component PulF [Cetobacterium ceti]|uniref:Type II secretory pathway, component PulF n=1 Tax=Cetobacterium ceti TaxID=180163 RepID=A0A1T4QIQ1_9FUSO|nr:type II secretion system F family protein [Cetobacterium ceti]SKA03574.1 Type II secretory pathway, component PulF [Cetobacterium ceti]
MLNKYIYSCMNESGKILKGEILEVSLEDAKKELKNKYKIILKIKLDNENLKKISPNKLKLFIKTMGSLLEGGITLKNALKTNLKLLKDAKVKKMVEKLIDNIEMGYSLSEILKKYTKIKKIYIVFLEVGEVTGNIGKAFKIIDTMQERESKYKMKFYGIMAYPLITIIFSFFILIGMSIFIAPKILEIYSTSEAKLPIITRIIIIILEILKKYFYIIFLFIFLFIYGLKNKKIRNVIFKISFLKKVFQEGIGTYFAIVLGNLLVGGLSLITALNFLKEIFERDQEKEIIEKMILRIKMGDTLGNICEEIKIFTLEELALIKISEETGELSKTFLLIGQMRENKLQEKLNLLLKIGEPLLIVGVGIFLSFFIIGLYLPFFFLGDSLSL